MKKFELRDYLVQRGAVLATIDDIFEESRILILTDFKVGDDADLVLVCGGYGLLFGYNIYQPRQYVTEENNYWFNFQAHLYVSCWIDSETNKPNVLSIIPGMMSGSRVGHVYIIDDRITGDKPCFDHTSRLIPDDLRINLYEKFKDKIKLKEN